MSVWQPIETAPKTSRAILIFVPENRCTYCVSWSRRGGWLIFGGGWRAQIQNPTHWQPLPEPPEVS